MDPCAELRLNRMGSACVETVLLAGEASQAENGGAASDMTPSPVCPAQGGRRGCSCRGIIFMPQKKTNGFTGWQVAVAAEAIAASQFARCGYDVSSSTAPTSRSTT